jgi:hypothetical protein
MNSMSQKLYPIEARLIREDPVLQERVLLSYKMMLNFYGFKLKAPSADNSNDEKSLERTELAAERLQNLALNSHNFLRITRILKSLGEFGLEDYKLGFIKALSYEVFVSGSLSRARDALLTYWLPVLRDAVSRSVAIEYVSELDVR